MFKKIVVAALIAGAAPVSFAGAAFPAVTAQQVVASYRADDGSVLLFTSLACRWNDPMYSNSFVVAGKDWGKKGERVGCYSFDYGKPMFAGMSADKTGFIDVTWTFRTGKEIVNHPEVVTGDDGDEMNPDQPGLSWSPAGRALAESVWNRERQLCTLKSDLCLN
jgi:hypothetical protein